MAESLEHLQDDIVIRPQTLVTCYRQGQAFCARCHRPAIQAGADELLNAPIGPVAKSIYAIGWGSSIVTARIEKLSAREPRPLCKLPLRFKPAETLRAYLAGPQQQSLFTFLRRPEVPPTNNHAEQSLRHLVIFRKICFGTRSDHGLKTHSILPSLVQTAGRQGIPPREFLHTLLTADMAIAQAALDTNSS